MDTTRKTKSGLPKFTAIRIDRERCDALRDLAKREDRSLAAIVRRMVDRELEREAA